MHPSLACVQTAIVAMVPNKMFVTVFLVHYFPRSVIQEGSTGIEPVIDTRFLHAASSSRRESDLPNSRWNAKVCLSLLWHPFMLLWQRFCYHGNIFVTMATIDIFHILNQCEISCIFFLFIVH